MILRRNDSSTRRLRVCFIPKTANTNVASYRLRCLGPHRILNTRSVDAQIITTSTYTPGCDIAVFQKAYTAHALELARTYRDRGAKIILDMCDNHLYNPLALPDFAARAKSLTEMVAFADLVTVASESLAIALNCEAKSALVEDPIERFQLAARVSGAVGRLWRSIPTHKLRVIWFGNAGDKDLNFGMQDIASQIPLLNTINANTNIHVTILSNDKSMFDSFFGDVEFSVSYREWAQTFTSFELARHDVCFIPVTLNPFTRCKTANRLVTATLNGLAVVATGIPSYNEFGEFVSLDDFEDGLCRYMDPRLRQEHVQLGQRVLRERFSDEVVGRMWLDAIEGLLS